MFALSHYNTNILSIIYIYIYVYHWLFTHLMTSTLLATTRSCLLVKSGRMLSNSATCGVGVSGWGLGLALVCVRVDAWYLYLFVSVVSGSHV